MIRARSAWWNPQVRVTSERIRWRVDPNPPRSGGMGRFASSGWDGAWQILSEADVEAPVGRLIPVRMGGVSYQIELRGDTFDLPNSRPTREFVWRGQPFQLVRERELKDGRGVQVARFHGRWLGVNAEISQSDLEELVAVLAVAITLIGVAAAA